MISIKISNKMILATITTLFTLSLIIQAAIIQDINPCLGKLTCRECIQTRGCAFCTEDRDFGDRPRCFRPELHLDAGPKCQEQFTVNPNTDIKIIENINLTRHLGGRAGGGGYISGGSYEAGGYSSSGGYKEQFEGSYGSSYHGHKESGLSQGKVVQVSPQRLSFKLRLNEEARFTIQYAQAVDYPVDLYYLMDLSKSMEDDKEKLSKLGDLLSETMRNITSNFKLGFGSFVDKVLMPYVSTVPKKLKHPCDGCEAPYGFRNHMPLNTDTRTFSEEVKKAAVSGNLDAPEGGFDAIMQAIVCRDIGWREQARHLLVFSTDAGFHYAGDGKLGGVITPNDGQCHLNPQGYYTHSTIHDYPSISQINQKVKNNSINIIFAVTKQQIEIYQKLVEHIEGSSSAILSSDSSNVVDIVREEYGKISSSVEMKTNIASEHIKATFYSSCLSGPLVQTNKCDNLKVGDVVSFNVELVATSCEQNQTQTFKIYPVGLTEGTVITVELICDCDCERPNHPQFIERASQCSYHGTLKCGICECYSGYFGENCQCSAQDSDIIDHNKGCRPDNTTLECSGRGNCVCGVCECTQRDNGEVVTGKYCECDNFSCERKGNILCSGHGECTCGQCVCIDGWSGSDCSCQVSNNTCIAPSSKITEANKLCSGFGQCVCGKCICDATDQFRYSGKYCEKCPTCASHCHEYKECVQCLMYGTGRLKDANACKKECEDKFILEEVETLEYEEEKEEYLCTFYDDDDCKFQFVYYENRTDFVDGYRPDTKKTTTTIVRAQKNRECPPKVFMLGIVLGVIAAIVLIGLAVLLLWKLLTTIHDRREFARFEKERMMAKWDTGENPIYKQATSTFKNPTYGK